MSVSTFIYVIYIRTACEQLWPALTEPELTRQYWFDGEFMSDWKLQSPWTFLSPNRRTINSGEVVEIQAPKHLVLTWRNELKPALRSEGYSRVVFELEQLNELVRLTLSHDIAKPESALIRDVAGGWPLILSSLKSLLETGTPLHATRQWPQGL
jgi:uncharacterized protein YndB with AHSA1/START domain